MRRDTKFFPHAQNDKTKVFCMKWQGMQNDKTKVFPNGMARALGMIPAN